MAAPGFREASAPLLALPAAAAGCAESLGRRAPREFEEVSVRDCSKGRRGAASPESYPRAVRPHEGKGSAPRMSEGTGAAEGAGGARGADAHAEEGPEPSQSTMLQHFGRKVKQRAAPKAPERKAPARASRAPAADGDNETPRQRAGRAAKEAAAAQREEEKTVVKAEEDETSRDAALLLQLFSSNGASAEFAAQGQPAEEAKDEGDDAVAGVDHKDWAWEPSCHEGLLTFHDGRKRWYHCTNCQYFNDRLYHSKMHYDRIHVKQGKSMPRKRKYMEPAGSKAGEGVALPPSTLKQPEPTRTRTRRPGDKWLKTSTSDSAASGFRYVSVHEREHLASQELGEKEEQMQIDEQENQPLSDDGAPSPTEIGRRAKALGLAEDETKLFCWEPADENVKRGFERGSAVRLFTPVYRFGTEILPESAHRPASWRPQQQQAAVIVSAQKENKGLRWWWYNPAPADFDTEDDDDLSQTPTQQNTPAKGGKQGQKTRGAQQQYPLPKGGGSQIPTMQALASVAQDVRVKQEDPEADGAYAGGPDEAPLGQIIPRFPAGCRGGGKNRRPGDADVKTKRVWRRWDAEEERLLKNAVTKLGTKDWSAIHEEMGTDRSIKQLQDHWNDTKNNRASKS